MTARSNFHSHTTYCDGALSPREMVEAAIAKGCDAFGFSGHSYTFFDESYCMSREGTEKYKAEITALKSEYAGRIEIFCGIEQDMCSTEPTDGYDYIIGSAHYIKKGDEYLSVDGVSGTGAGILAEVAREHYGGDFYALCRDYYEQLARVYEVTHCDIVGHFDLVAKFNEDGALFDDSDPRYTGPAIDALCAILKKHRLFELNTGQMYRLSKKNPFPAPFLLRELHARGGEIILSSDSHDAESICHRFDDAEELLRTIGFTHVKKMMKTGFADVPIV